jgi:hypothetical protein
MHRMLLVGFLYSVLFLTPVRAQQKANAPTAGLLTAAELASLKNRASFVANSTTVSALGGSLRHAAFLASPSYASDSAAWESATRGQISPTLIPSLWDGLTFQRATSSRYLSGVQAVNSNVGELDEWASSLKRVVGPFSQSLAAIQVSAALAGSYVTESGRPWDWKGLKSTQDFDATIYSDPRREAAWALVLLVQQDRLFTADAFSSVESKRLRARLLQLVEQDVLEWQLAFAFPTSGDAAMSLVTSDDLFAGERLQRERLLRKRLAARAAMISGLMDRLHVDESMNPYLRAPVAAMLGMMKADEAVKPLLQLMRDGDPRSRVEASWGLGLIASPGSIDPILSLAREDAGQLGIDIGRLAPIEVMAAAGDTNAIQAIGRLFKDVDPRIRERAISFLRTHYEDKTKVSGYRFVVADARVIDFLIGALSDNALADSDRRALILQLGDRGDRKAIEPLIVAMEAASGNPTSAEEIQGSCNYALSKITGQKFAGVEEWRQWLGRNR